MKPARSYSPVGVNAGISAVSPPISSAAVHSATPGKARHDTRTNLRIELADSKIVEKEKGLSTLNSDVVDAMIDQVFADGVVATRGKSDFQLRADAVRRTHYTRDRANP